ncbi:spermine/spermidine synthase domain-containing protein [Denitromonas iodatirespirans]|uniref:Spermidine synthase-like protein n=1 Tax=Denitromonas iodatirespirans TaxID=2795389 RepID=A0A944DC94_DENI1|nr:spermidine synthase-like protein [Denitromonas iodatirespirans]MBT0962391.1 spermidine synthase-like protein [Denitromonas iodatirespirans]
MPAPPLFEMPSPFITEAGRVLLHEPADADAEALRERLLAEDYDRPFVIDDGEHRSLYFTLRLIQSSMRTRTPDALALRYTQMMMLFVLFLPRPQRLALIGLGGGSLLKCCHRHLPSSHFTAIEMDADVIAFRELFALPPDGERVSIVHGDGAVWLAEAPPGLDVLLVDAFTGAGLAPSLAGAAFFEQAADTLAERGLLVLNLAGEVRAYADLVGIARSVFDDRVILLPVPDDGNHLLFAFKDPAFRPDWRRLRQLAVQAQPRFGLDLPAFAERLERAAKHRLAERLFDPAR